MNHPKLSNSLNGLQQRLAGIAGDDLSCVIPIGVALEEASSLAASGPACVRDALQQVLNVLKSLFEDTGLKAHAILPQAASLVGALETWASTDNDDALRNIMNARSAMTLAQAMASASSAPVDSPPATPTANEPIAAPASLVVDKSPTKAVVNDARAFQFTDCLPADADVELLGEFIAECMDHIASAEVALLALETNPGDVEQVNTIFRSFHTIKGASGFLGLDRIQKCAHLAENLLDRARSGQIRIAGQYADLALESCDCLKAMISGLRGLKGGDVLPVPDGFMILLNHLLNPESCEDESLVPPRVGDILVAEGKTSRKAIETVADNKGTLPMGEAIVRAGEAEAADVAKALRTQKQISESINNAGDTTLRVSTSRLDSLMNMIGELVISQSMMAQDTAVTDGSNPRLARNVSHAGKIVRELQDLTMSLRMVPLKQTFQKMVRLVRDLSHKSGKSVHLVCEGEDTEIDRNMVESLGDPLVHMIRNAVDHGIESPEGRATAGKNPTGTVVLRAYHSAGNVVIEMEDDGRGLDREKILAKAIERGLIESARDMSDSDIFNLIFHPGFSTADKITDVSGRGVGMDVVKKNITSLRGRVIISSRPGQGAKFTLRLPLTTAITDAMLLRVGRQRFLLPTISIQRSFRPDAGAVSTVTGRGEVVMLRGQFLPVFRLHRLFNISDAATDPCQGLLIVIEAEGRQCAIMADELLGQQQVVIKSLGAGLGRVAGVSGGGILGDGAVGLILDAAGLMKLAYGERDHMAVTGAAA